MKKVAVFAFKGEAMCFVHALLNVLDLKARGFEALLVVEGMAVVQIKEQGNAGAPFYGLLSRLKEAGLIAAVCRACSVKMEVLAAVEEQGLPRVDDMSGHVAMSTYLEQGFEIITL